LNWLKAIVVFIVVITLIGTVLTSGQVQSAFEQLFVMGFVFVLVVTFVPQLIVDEKKDKQNSQ
jgi:ABC-type branched-subunit amino acid transport system permease subunit